MEEPASVELTVTVGGDVVVEAVRDAHEAVWMHEPRGPRPPLAELPGLHETTRRQDGWAPYAPLEPRP